MDHMSASNISAGEVGETGERERETGREGGETVKRRRGIGRGRESEEEMLALCLPGFSEGEAMDEGKA